MELPAGSIRRQVPYVNWLRVEISRTRVSGQTKSMKTLEAQVPEILSQEVNELARKQNASVDQIVCIALAAQVSARRTRESIESRARRVNWQTISLPAYRTRQPGDELSK